MKKLLITLLAGILALIPVAGCPAPDEAPMGMAVEFMDHAAGAYISQDKGWFEEAGLNLTAYESYVTGMALASALARDEIEVAYICLVPAINVYANGGVPIKIVAGTHKYGYGLVVDPAKIKTVRDLENPGTRLGCVREGGAVDVLMHRTIDYYNLDEAKILSNTQRMNPPKLVLAIKTGQLDAAFIPEQWATMTEELGFTMLLTSQDVWSDMQGSVLVVKQELINNHPEVVQKLVNVSQRATDWINEHPQEAAEVVAGQMQASGSEVFPAEAAGIASQLEITPEVLLRSMGRMEYTTEINPEIVQATIDYIASLGYIKNSFNAADILDLRFLEGE
ncbi:MAG: ABC transporter substrate-binding protein [Deltaproteobacteria bacterium]|nr:ABC transporter substrate-binding protein [Deltaproteobacteria bacterium]